MVSPNTSNHRDVSYDSIIRMEKENKKKIKDAITKIKGRGENPMQSSEVTQLLDKSGNIHSMALDSLARNESLVIELRLSNKEKDALIEKANKQLDEFRSLLLDKENIIQNQQSIIRTQESKLRKRLEKIEQASKVLQSKDDIIRERDKKIDEFKFQIDQVQAKLAETQTELTTNEAKHKECLEKLEAQEREHKMCFEKLEIATTRNEFLIKQSPISDITTSLTLLMNQKEHLENVVEALKRCRDYYVVYVDELKNKVEQLQMHY